jgi:hypothetical protein
MNKQKVHDKYVQLRAGAAAIALLLVFGCASTPKPIRIKHDITQPQSEAASPAAQTTPTAQVEATLPGKQGEMATDARGVTVTKEAAKESATGKAGTGETAPAPSPERSSLEVKNADTNTSGPLSVSAVSSLEERNSAAATEALIKNIQAQLRTELTASVEELLNTLQDQVREQVRNEMLREIWTVRQELKTVEDQVSVDVSNNMLRELWKVNWAMKEKDNRLRFGGDFRVRYESIRYDKMNDPAGYYRWPNYTTTANDTVDQERFKYRIRFGTEAQVNEDVEVIARLSTGSTSNPVSANSTMGDYMNRDTVMFDLAYVKWQATKNVSFSAGRMPNPYFSSDLVWANDLNFEGMAIKARDAHAEGWSPFLTLGAFPLFQTELTQHQKWLFGEQLGMEKKDKKAVSIKVGAAYYDFKNIEGTANDSNATDIHANDWTAPQFVQWGNSIFNIEKDGTILAGLASKFEELNMTGNLDIGFWDPVHIVFLADYVKNYGFREADIRQRTGATIPLTKEVEGYQYGLSVGYPVVQEAKQWKAYYYYKSVQSDAVVDAFTDSDFHRGGTNAKGWILGGDVGLGRNYWLALKWMSADSISGTPLGIDTLQADLNARF